MEPVYSKNLFDLSQTIAQPLFAAYTYPWEVLPHIGAYITALGLTLNPEEYIQTGDALWIHRDAAVASSASVSGPAIICQGAEIRHGAYIRTNALVGRGAVVGNSTELKNVILFDSAQAPHYNYVGDSLLGYKAHMGAGSITSNLKADHSLVVIRDGNREWATGLKKVGALLGDYAEVGCNAVLNPGTIVGRHTNIYPLTMARGVIPPHSILKNTGVIVPKY